MKSRMSLRSSSTTPAAIVTSLGLFFLALSCKCGGAVTVAETGTADTPGESAASGTGNVPTAGSVETGVSSEAGVRGARAMGRGTPGVVGFDGIAKFDGLSSAQKDKVRSTSVFFMHMSVGDYMLDGAKELGFPFGYADAAKFYDSNKLGALAFGEVGVGNHNALGKVDGFVSKMASQMGNRVNLAGFKLCYSDIEDGVDLTSVKNRYAQQITNLKSRNPAVRFIHVTTPVEGNTSWALKMNVMRMDFANWLRQTYASVDVVFDLQDIESRHADGSSCQNGGTLYLCEDNDWSNDRGHPNPTTQVRLAKAFLYSIYSAVH